MPVARQVGFALLSWAALNMFVLPARAGDYDNDVKDAVTLLDKKAGEVGMLEDDRRKFDDLLGKYNDERSKLLEQMVTIVEKSDIAEQKNAWVDLANKGRELIERLESDVPKTNGNEGLTAAGLVDFSKGEHKIWEAVAKGDIALSAEIINRVTEIDLKVLKKCEEDLKTCRDGDRAIQAVLEQCENDMTSTIKDCTEIFAKKLGEKALTGWLKEGNPKEVAKEAYKSMVKIFEMNLKNAKDKRLLKEILLQDIKLISDAKDNLGESKIQDEYKKAEDNGKNLPGIGSNGDYKAADWDRFQQNAVKGLAEAKSRALEQTKKVYNEILPVFIEENTKKFVSVQDDPSKLADWEKDLKDEFKNMDDVLDKEDDYIKDLTKGDYRTAVEETAKDVREFFKTGLQGLLDSEKADDEEMKR